MALLAAVVFSVASVACGGPRGESLVRAVVAVEGEAVAIDRPELPDSFRKDDSGERAADWEAVLEGVGAEVGRLADGLQTLRERVAAEETRRDVVRPVNTVLVYVSPGCAPCRRLRRDVVEYSGLAFEFVGAPDGVVAPRLEWSFRRPGGGTARYFVEGWRGLEDFVGRYNASVAEERRR